MTQINDHELLESVADELAIVKEDVTGIKMSMKSVENKMDQKFASQDNKLDKILEVITNNLSWQDKKIRRVENHLGLPPMV